MKNATCTTHNTEANKAFPSARFYCTVSKSEVWVLKLNKTHNTQFHRPIVFKKMLHVFLNEMLPVEFCSISNRQGWNKPLLVEFHSISNALEMVCAEFHLDKTHILSHNFHATSSFLLMVTSLNGNETPTGTGLTVLRNHPHGITNEATLAIISRTDVIGCTGYFHK